VAVFGEDVDRDKFDVEFVSVGDCCELRVSARIRAISLLVKPAGIGTTGRERGTAAGGAEDRRWRATISADGSSVTKGCWPVEIPESSVSSREFGSKGVTFVSEPASSKSGLKGRIVDLGLARLRRSCTKAEIPITARMAPAPPMMPPTIAPMFRFLCGVGLLAFIVSTGALRGSKSGMNRWRRVRFTNFSANGANTAPCAGLINVIATSTGAPDPVP
jgi:hypothetical protein